MTLGWTPRPVLAGVVAVAQIPPRSTERHEEADEDNGEVPGAGRRRRKHLEHPGEGAEGDGAGAAGAEQAVLFGRPDPLPDRPRRLSPREGASGPGADVRPRREESPAGGRGRAARQAGGSLL